MSGSVPDGYTLTTTGTGTIAISAPSRTLAADGDAGGTYLRLAITGANNLIANLTLTSSILSRISANDRLRYSVRTRLSSGSSPGSGAPVQLSYLRNVAQITFTNYQTYNMAFSGNAGGFLPSEASGWITFRANDFVVPEAPTGITVPS